MIFPQEYVPHFVPPPLEGYPRIRLNSEISIGMSAHGNYATTLSALTALFMSVEGDFELILVDDCSPDATLALFCRVAEYHPNTTIFSFISNLEYSGSLNAILSHAKGNFVLFLSNDILVTPAYISTLLEVARHSEEFGIVRGTANFVDDGLAHHNVVPEQELPSIKDLFCFSDSLRQSHGDELSFDRFLTGDAFLVTRQVLDAIGGLDPLFYGYFADHDFGLRAIQAGFKLVLARGAFALHEHMANFDCLPSVESKAKRDRRWMRVYENWARFKMKYDLPVEQPYTGVRNIEWEKISESSALARNLFVQPKDYTSHLLSEFRNGLVVNDVNLSQRARRYMLTGRLTDASNLCEWGLRNTAVRSTILSALGGVKLYQGYIEEAIAYFRSVLEHDPRDFKAHSNLLLTMNYSEKYSQQDIFDESKHWEFLHGCRATAIPATAKDKNQRLRLGFISGDMKRHSISYFLEPLLEKIDRTCFEIYCYSDVTSPDFVTERLKKLSDVWRETSALADDALADVIRENQIDILIDLAGHTGTRIRLPVFSSKPAPIQVSWLGYPNTTGLASVDYRLTDVIADPPGLADELHSEKLLRLPHGFLCYRSAEDAPEVGPLPVFRNGYITFGSCNLLPKISPGVIAVWSRLLRRVKNSRLLVKSPFFSDLATVERYIGYFCDFGISRERIDIRAALPTVGEHLAVYHEIDIALDTFPYNGTTTTCEALWMGVPVITLSGDRHAARVGASILARLGLSELVASSPAEYVNLAGSLANNWTRLDTMHSSLRQSLAASVLCDSDTFAAQFKTALTSIAAQ